MQVFLRARRLTAALCVTGVTVLVSVFSASGASAQSTLEVNYDFGAAALANFNAPMVPPPGSNNWSCKPAAARLCDHTGGMTWSNLLQCGATLAAHSWRVGNECRAVLHKYGQL